ncbi:universal stress protein family protein [Microbacterium sp. AG1240]|uniref:universal stress protein n=1 Tax=Microbacterium sp. AG1240 TaxID=2183992 RepID=UPI000EAC6EEF|nr:universal stress protein [Microbacterium sp. AG1240]RKT31108.1 universal stress protein family protein [Microbacterium sp. AG1240]
MGHIVLGFDGSAAADSALDWVAERVSARPAGVVLVVVANMFHAERPVLERFAQEASERLRARVPDAAVDIDIVDGRMPGTLSRSAEGAELLVVGMHTNARARSMFAGAIPLRLTALSAVPVVLVPAGWAPRDAPVTVGLAADGSSAAALRFAAVEALAQAQPLRIVHSWLMTSPLPSAPAGGGSAAREAHDVHRAIVDGAVAALTHEHPGLVAEAALVRDNPAAALTSQASRSSLVVIGTHRRGLLTGWLLGSVAWDLVGELDDPICVVPPPLSSAGSTTRIRPGVRRRVDR